MGLLEQLEEDKKLIAEALESGTLEDSDDEVIESDDETESDSEPQDESEKLESDAGEEKKEVELEEKLDPSEYARLRREKKALQRQLEAEQSKKDSPPVQDDLVDNKESDPEPDKTKNYPEWLEWKDRRNEEKLEKLEKIVNETVSQRRERELYDSAVQEFQSFEEDFRLIEPTYDDAAKFYTDALAKSIKILNPQATPKQIGETIQAHVIQKAAQYYSAGLDPAEEFFNEAKQLGFSNSSEKAEPKKISKPNMEKVAENRSRNSGMAAVSGNDAKKINIVAAANMTTGEFMKLSKSERESIMKGR